MNKVSSENCDVKLVASGDNLVIRVKMDGKKVNAMLVPGAAVSVIDEETLQYMQVDYQTKPPEKQIFDASGNKMNVVGVANFKVEIPGTKCCCDQTFYIIRGNNNSKVLLGRDFMASLGVVSFDFANNKV